MHALPYLGLLLATVTLPQPPVWAVALTAALAWAVWTRNRWTRTQLVYAAALWLFSAALWVQRANQFRDAPSPPEMAPLARLTAPERYFGPASLDRVAEVFASRPRLGDPDAAALLDRLQLPPFVSVTALNLNFEPIVWKGAFFSNAYKQLTPNRPELLMRDGRLFFVNLKPLPSEDLALGYLAVESVALTKHSHERGASWFGLVNPRFRHFLPVEAPPEYSDLLLHIAEGLDTEPPPYDLHLVYEPQQSFWLDAAALAWALLFLLAVVHTLKQVPVRRAFWPPMAGLLILAAPHHGELDYLTVFGSYVFGSKSLGSLLSTPFHFFLASGFLFLTLQSLWRGHFRERRWAAYGPALLALGLVFAPDFFQKHNAFSFVHPLEAFSSPGAFLSYLAFLSVFAYAALLIKASPAIGLNAKLAALAPVFVLTLWLRPDQWSVPITLALIWMLSDRGGPLALKTALAALAFYPGLVVSEQRQEVAYLRNNLLDEITLFVERNYFRMGRIIQRLPDFLAQLERAPHSRLTEMFARQAGLFEDEVDFALRLQDPSGNLASAVEQHLSMDRIRTGLGPEDRIEVFREADSGEAFMVYRRTLPTSRGDYEFAAALGNDYLNLSPVRRLRRFGDVGPQRWSQTPTPYFSHTLDVFALNGAPLYYQGETHPLSEEIRKRLAQDAYFWRVDGRNTLFYLRDDHYLYRITHKATPRRMVIARFLALFLAIAALARGVQLAQRPGRGLVSRWRRSFAMKLAGFMFLTSVLPTSMLGFFLINSIQRNQAREEASIAQSKIQAAKNLFRSFGEFDPRRPPVFNEPPAEEDAATPETPAERPLNLKNLPIQKYARILGEDLSLYLFGSLEKTNQPEAFRQGYLNRRLPYELARELFIEKKAYTLERIPLGGDNSMLVAYASIDIDANRAAVLSMTMIPYSQRQSFRWLEQLEFSVTLLFGLLFIMALLTRFLAKSFLNPVSAITRGASRMAKGVENRPIEIHRQDELERMIQAFNTMQDRVKLSRNALQQQLGVLDETLNAMSSGLLGFNREGRVILENPKVWALLMLSDRPRDLDSLIAAEPSLEPLRGLFDAADTGEFPFHLTRDDAEREMVAKFRWVEARQDHDINGILAIEDITDAIAASRFKAWSEMARRVAHEIKNPLTPIQLEIDFLAKMHHDKHPGFGEALDDAVVQIGKQVQDLRRIAAEFSDYARPIKLDPAPVDLTEMIDVILAPYEKTIEGVDFRKDLADRLVANVDGRLLRRALHNLLVNAIQAMDEAGRLGVRLFRDDAFIHIWIEDSGPGIPKEERGRIFEAYFSTKDQGTGLGLVIAKKYILLHGGSLSIDQDFREGTRFIIRLPIELACDETEESPS